MLLSGLKASQQLPLPLLSLKDSTQTDPVSLHPCHTTLPPLPWILQSSINRHLSAPSAPGPLHMWPLFLTSPLTNSCPLLRVKGGLFPSKHMGTVSFCPALFTATSPVPSKHRVGSKHQFNGPFSCFAVATVRCPNCENTSFAD